MFLSSALLHPRNCKILLNFEDPVIVNTGIAIALYYTVLSHLQVTCQTSRYNIMKHGSQAEALILLETIPSCI